MASIKSILTLTILFSVISILPAQPGIRYYDDRAMDGYILYESGNRAVLIDNCGHLIHEWTDIAARFHPKLQPNGHIIYIEVFSDRIIEKDWDDNIVNEIEVNSNTIAPDYEVILMDNGNYLCVGRRSFTQAQFEEIGYNYGSLGVGNPSQVDVVMELDRLTGNIVWLWDISDHVIQERSASINNFGDVSAHPELLNMDAIGTFDWTFQESFMINGFDYNPQLDQIALSVRKMSEIVIIDHSTTTAEAAGHTGGNSGKGGDILYRWGNPQNYGRGTAADRKLWFQHNPNWITDGPHAGKLITYNNGLSGPGFSTAPIISTPVDANGNYALSDGEAYGPDSPDVEYGNGLGEDFYSGYTSGAKVLANGNVLITVGGSNRAFEMLPDGTLVWEYGLYDSNLTFRVEKYAADYPAFVGRDLTAGEPIEFPPSEVSCSLVDVSDSYFEDTKVWASDHKLYISISQSDHLDMKLYTVSGSLLRSQKVSDGMILDISSLVDGVYLVRLSDPISGVASTYKIYN